MKQRGLVLRASWLIVYPVLGWILGTMWWEVSPKHSLSLLDFLLDVTKWYTYFFSLGKILHIHPIDHCNKAWQNGKFEYKQSAIVLSEIILKIICVVRAATSDKQIGSDKIEVLSLCNMMTVIFELVAFRVSFNVVQSDPPFMLQCKLVIRFPLNLRFLPQSCNKIYIIILITVIMTIININYLALL